MFPCRPSYHATIINLAYLYAMIHGWWWYKKRIYIQLKVHLSTFDAVCLLSCYRHSRKTYDANHGQTLHKMSRMLLLFWNWCTFEDIYKWAIWIIVTIKLYSFITRMTLGWRTALQLHTSKWVRHLVEVFSHEIYMLRICYLYFLNFISIMYEHEIKHMVLVMTTFLK